MRAPADRVWSTIQIKSINEETRTLEGVATTPTTDLMDDVVEPMGGEYTVPMPFLMDHGVKGSDDSVGHVIEAKPGKDGIAVRVKMAKSALLPHLDQAWEKIRLGLVTGLSIGFKPIEWEPIKDSKSFGLRYKKWRWLELSAVVVAANTDCSITAIKSADLARRAASGRNVVVRLSTPAGVTATPLAPQEGTTTMDIATQTKALEAKRMASADAVAAIADKAAAEGRTFDETEQQEYDNLLADVKSVDKHLANLRELESLNAARAKPVTEVKSVVQGSAARETQSYITLRANQPQGNEFVHYVKCLAMAKGDPMRAHEIAKLRYPDEHLVHTVLKGAIAAGTTTDATWAGPLVEFMTLSSAFLDYLRPKTIIGQFGTGGIPSLQNVPFNIRFQSETSAGEGYWVGEGAAKPLTSFSYAADTLGPTKVANIAVLTQESVRFSNPKSDDLVRRGLAAALIARLDIDFIDPNKAAVANISPASITNGVTPISSSGTSLNDARTDIEALMAAFIGAQIMPNCAIMSSMTALVLSMMRNELGQPSFPGISLNGGTFSGLPVIVSEYVTQVGDSTGSPIVFLDTNSILMADDGNVTIDASTEASLQMDDAPTGNSATATGTSVVSMYQTNSIAIRAERFINWKVARPGAVQYIAATAYTSSTAT